MSGPGYPPKPYDPLNRTAAREQTSPSHMVEDTALLVEMASSISGELPHNLTSINEGVGKSTLLRHIAMREVPIPPHITILFVEQEVGTIRLAPVIRSRDPLDYWG